MEDLSKLLKQGQGVPGAAGAHDLSQPAAPPMMSGIMVNGQSWTINEVEQLEEGDFREFFLGVVVGMMGGHYVSARAIEQAEAAAAAGEPPPPTMGGDSEMMASAEVLKAEDTADDD